MRPAALAVLIVAVCLGQRQTKPRFLADDPIQAMPAPNSIETAKPRSLSDQYDYFLNTFGHPGELSTPKNVIRARAVNTLGEVPDSEWYTNRHYLHPMTTAQIVAGAPGQPPESAGPWTIVAAKNEGVTPGFTILDKSGRRYVMKFDPPGYQELATAADVISSKFFHALGYNVPANFIVEFDREHLVLGDETMLTDSLGKRRRMTSKDLGDVLSTVARNEQGRYRAVASFYLSGSPLGPFRYHGTRKDDPNDIVPHEHRRDLRGLRLFCAWLNHDDSRSINTLDMLVQQGGRKFVRHHLIDFGSTLGSATYGPNSPRSGNEYVFSWKRPAAEFFTLGLYLPHWTRAKFPRINSVGRFESEVFDPEQWVPEYKNPAFLNQLPDDAFWAARQIMAFTDEQIQAVVESGKYSDPRATEWVTQCLIQRRDKIGRAYLQKVLPLDRFAIQGGELTFADLAVAHGMGQKQPYTISWSRFNNETHASEPVANATGAKLPAMNSGFLKAAITSGSDKRALDVFVRVKGGKSEVVGVERRW